MVRVHHLRAQARTNKVKNQLTLAVIFVVIADLLAVIDQWSLGVQVCTGPVWQRLVVQVEQFAVVRRAHRRSFEDERPAEELVFDLTSQPTRRLAGHLGK